MKLVTVVWLANSVAAGAIGPNATVPESSLKVIQGVMNELGQQLDSLDTQVKYFANDTHPVEEAAANVVQTLRTGKTTIDAQRGLSLGEAFALPKTVDMIKAKSKALLVDLLAKKDVIESGNHCGMVRQQTIVINNCSKDLINATIMKVPPIGRPIAWGMSGPLLNVMKESQQKFNEANCINKGTPLPNTTAEAQPSSSSTTT